MVINSALQMSIKCSSICCGGGGGGGDDSFYQNIIREEQDNTGMTKEIDISDVINSPETLVISSL